MNQSRSPPRKPFFPCWSPGILLCVAEPAVAPLPYFDPWQLVQAPRGGCGGFTPPVVTDGEAEAPGEAPLVPYFVPWQLEQVPRGECGGVTVPEEPGIVARGTVEIRETGDALPAVVPVVPYFVPWQFEQVPRGGCGGVTVVEAPGMVAFGMVRIVETGDVVVPVAPYFVP